MNYVNYRLIRLRNYLAHAELDKANNALYIDDLKESIAFEEKRMSTVYEAMKYDEHRV